MPKSQVASSARAWYTPPGPLSHFLTTPYSFRLPGFLFLASLQKLGRHTKSPGHSQSEGALGAWRAETWPGPLHSSPQALAVCEPLLLYIPQSWVLARLLLLPGALPQGCNPAIRLPDSSPPPSWGGQVPGLHSDFSTSPQGPFPPSSVPPDTMLLQGATTCLLPKRTPYLLEVKGLVGPSEGLVESWCPPTSEARPMGTQV